MATIVAGTATGSDTSLSAHVQKYVDKNLIPNLRGMAVLSQYTRKGRLIPGTNTLELLEMADIAADSSYLPSETTNPVPEALSLATIDVTTNEIGRVVAISRRARNISAFDVAQAAEERLRFDANRRIETEIANAAKASGTVRYSGGATSRATVAATTSFADLRKARTKLDSAFAPKFGDNTRKWLSHPFVIGDLMAETTPGSWIDANRFATPEAIMAGVIGKIYGQLVQEFDFAPVFLAGGQSSADVYVNLNLGNNAIASATIEDLQVRVVPNTPDKADALGRLYLVGYYMDFGTKAIKSTWYVRHETAATAL